MCYNKAILCREVRAVEQVEATVRETIYRNAENGYSVIQCKGDKRSFTAVGALPQLSSGERVTLSGEWTEHPQYGPQFKVSAYEIHQPGTLLGIERYLGSGLIHGVGPSTARQIVQHFGMDTLEVLSEHPERLQELPGMGRKRWRHIAESFQEQQTAREAMIFLQGYGISAKLSVKISRLYGDRAPEVIRNNPYRLVEDLEGVGFLTADRIAASLGIAPDSEFRLQAALKYLLRDAAGSAGHVYLPQGYLTQRCAQLLHVEEELVARQLQTLMLRRELIAGGTPEEPTAYLPQYDAAEREVAQRLMELMAALAPQQRLGVAQEIDRFERERNIR